MLPSAAAPVFFERGLEFRARKATFVMPWRDNWFLIRITKPAAADHSHLDVAVAVQEAKVADSPGRVARRTQPGNSQHSPITRSEVGHQKSSASASPSFSAGRAARAPYLSLLASAAQQASLRVESLHTKSTASSVRVQLRHLDFQLGPPCPEPGLHRTKNRLRLAHPTEYTGLPAVCTQRKRAIRATASE